MTITLDEIERQLRMVESMTIYPSDELDKSGCESIVMVQDCFLMLKLAVLLFCVKIAHISILCDI